MSLSRKFFVRTSKDPSTFPFVDVQDPTSYCYDAVLWAVENGVTNGYDDTHFCLASPALARRSLPSFGGQQAVLSLLRIKIPLRM